MQLVEVVAVMQNCCPRYSWWNCLQWMHNSVTGTVVRGLSEAVMPMMSQVQYLFMDQLSLVQCGRYVDKGVSGIQLGKQLL